MDDTTPNINPKASQDAGVDQDRVAQETRVRFALQRKFSQDDDPQLLFEKVSKHPHGRRSRRIVKVLLVLLGGGAIGVLILNTLVIPRFMSGLPGLLHSPYKELEGYKRTIKAAIDYYPPVVVSQKKIGISEFDHGASFSLVSSADVIPHDGLEGIARLDINKTKSAGASDIDLGYKVVFPREKEEMGVYFFFNHWPSYLQEIGLSGDSRGTWFGYDGKDVNASQEGLRELVSILDPESGHAEVQQFVTALWTYAISKGALQWKIENLYRGLSDGTRVIDVRVEVDPEKFPSAIADFANDPGYTGTIKAVGEAPLAGTKIINLLKSVRSLNGLFTIGMKDRYIHEAAWSFDINDRSAGTYRGTLVSSLDIIQVKKKIVKPDRNLSAADILGLFVPETSSGESTTTPPDFDSDGDGLSDVDEGRYHSDPLVTDTDKDGFSDGVEVQKGFDPAGPGPLKK